MAPLFTANWFNFGRNPGGTVDAAFSASGGNIDGATPEVINTATSGGLTGITSITPAVEASRAFTPFKALAGGGIKDLWEDEGTNMMMLLISSLLQEGMEG